MSALADKDQAVLDYSHVSISRRKEILRDFSWHVSRNEHWVIVGPNGAGKTTLARMAAGVEYPDSGEVYIDGVAVSALDSRELGIRVGFASAEVQSRISPDESAVGAVLSAAWGQSIRYGEEYEALDLQRAKDLLSALGVPDIAEQPFVTLSEGEKRRTLIARALMPDPEIVILDEPTAGLDLAGRETLVSALAEIMSAPTSPTFILVTHELEEIPSTFTHALILDKTGEVISSAPIVEALTNQNITRAFDMALTVTFDGKRWWGQAAQPE